MIMFSEECWIEETRFEAFADEEVTQCVIPSVRPDLWYCFRSGRCRPNPRTKHIPVPPRHMTKSYISDFNMISQHYRYKDTHLIQSAYNCLKYITSAEDIRLGTGYKQMPSGKGKTTHAHIHMGPGSPPGTPS